MLRDSDSDSGDASGAGDDLTFTRRSALALMGAGGVAAATGNAAASHGDAPGNETGRRTRKWNQDVNAQDHDLDNLHSIDVDHVYASARDADVVVWKDDDGGWHADGRDGHVTSTDDVMLAATAAIESLTDGRDHKEKVAIVSPAEVGPHSWGDGPWDGFKEIRVPSNTILDVPAPIHIKDSNEPLIRAVYANDADNVEFPNLNIKGNPRYAVWLQGVREARLGAVNIEMDAEQTPRGGLAVRIDSFGDSERRCKDVQVDTAYIEEAGWQAFETYGVDRLQVGQVIANKTPGSGVLLNNTTDATIGQVVGREVNPGGGYATFRVANECADVTCGQVVGRDGGRGVFGVSGCEDVTINSVNLVGMSSHGVLVQDCQNFSVQGGVIKNSNAEGVRIDSRDAGGIPEDPRNFAATSGVSITDLRVVDDRDEPKMPFGIRETGPDTTTSRIVGNDVRGSGTRAAMEVFAPDTTVKDNVGGGVDAGNVTLTSGSSPAARVTDVSDAVGASLAVRARAASNPGAAFGFDTRFEWTGSAWDLVFEWTADPGSDLDVTYIVDQQQAKGFVPSSSGGSGGAADLTGDLVDSFEDGDLSEYEGATDAYTVNTDDPVADGDYSLKKTAEGTAIFYSTSGLPRYPSAGDEFFARVARTETEVNAGIAFGVQDADNFYFARIYDTNRLQLYKREGGSYSQLAESVISTSANTLYSIVVDWGTDGTIDVEVLGPEGDSLATVNTTDTAFSEGGIGARKTGVLDDVRIK
ncbi:MAG: hypothetical protein ABEJ68_02170 [Halobacteriaceae archaeon]